MDLNPFTIILLIIFNIYNFMALNKKYLEFSFLWGFGVLGFWGFGVMLSYKVY
jgi:hypothetical protein